MHDIKLGPLEFALRIVPTDGEAFDVVTTPSEFARADEFIDTLRASGLHTERWLIARTTPAIAMLAAQRHGRWRSAKLSVEELAEFQNTNTIEDAPVKEGRDAPDEPDPTKADPDGGPAAS